MFPLTERKKDRKTERQKDEKTERQKDIAPVHPKGIKNKFD
jgi:hypothetical protein